MDDVWPNGSCERLHVPSARRENIALKSKMAAIFGVIPTRQAVIRTDPRTGEGLEMASGRQSMTASPRRVFAPAANRLRASTANRRAD